MVLDPVVRYESKLTVLIPNSIPSSVMKNPKTLLRVSVIGTAIVALCCFTPILVILLGVAGLSAITGYLDLVLLPALVIFVVLTAYALWRKKQYDAFTDDSLNTSSWKERQ